MKYRWTRAADDDRLAIWHWNSNFGEEEANRVDRLIERAAEFISRSPFVGVTGRYRDTYEVPLGSNLRLIYEPRPDGVVILAVLHAAFVLSDINDSRPPFKRY